MHYRLSALSAQTCRSVRVCAKRIHAARRRRWDQPLGRPLESSRSTAETVTVNPSVTQRLPVTKHANSLSVTRTNSSCITAPAHQILHPPSAPYFHPGRDMWCAVCRCRLRVHTYYSRSFQEHTLVFRVHACLLRCVQCMDETG